MRILNGRPVIELLRSLELLDELDELLLEELIKDLGISIAVPHLSQLTMMQLAMILPLACYEFVFFTAHKEGDALDLSNAPNAPTNVWRNFAFAV